MFVIKQIRHLSRRTDHGLFPSRHSQILLVFFVKICASHLHFSLSCVPLQRLNCLQTVIDGRQSRRTFDGRNVEIPQISIGHELLHTMVGILAGGLILCRGQHVSANQHGAWINCARCAFRLHYIPSHAARMTSVSTPSPSLVQGSECLF